MKVKHFIPILCIAALISSCDRELPYDLDGVQKSVVINIGKVIGSSTTLQLDPDSGDYRIALTIPEQQGDYSMLEEAQLVAVYTYDIKKPKIFATVVEGIKTFPAVITIDMNDVMAKLNIDSLSIGDRIEFAVSHTLKNGTQVDAYMMNVDSTYFYNNTYFSGWKMADGSSFKNKISYTAFAPFHKEYFQGDVVGIDDAGDPYPFTVTQIAELPPAEWIPVGVTAEDLVGLKLEGDFWFGGDVMKIWINTQDFTLIVPDQVICPDFTYGAYGTYNGEITDGEGEVDTKNNLLTFYFYSIWGPYSFGDVTFVLDFNP